MKGKLSSRQRIGHAIDAINEIESYTSDQAFTEFLVNSMMQFACIKQLEIIGEACNHVDEETTNAFPQVEWRKIVGLRNVLIHEYFGVDAMLVWDIIQTNLPYLKRQLQEILESH